MNWVKFSLAFLLVLVVSHVQAGSSPDEIWTDVSLEQLDETLAEDLITDIMVDPVNKWVTELNLEVLKAVLARAPDELIGSARSDRPEPVTLYLPTPEGEYEQFEFFRTEVMSPELAAKFPDIQTYSGVSVSEPSIKVRLDLTAAGFHAQVLAAGYRWYVDPQFKENTGIYVSYFKEDVVGESHSCLLEEEDDGVDDASKRALVAARSGDLLRTYRLAVATTGEYAQFHGGTTEGALSAVVTTVNRVNGIYERELAIRLVLVGNNDSIVYTDPASDPFVGNFNARTLIDESQSEIDDTIGSANYDIGHTFSTGAGGLAGLGVVCSSRKANGVTGLSNPSGDSFDVDFVAHEIGHQFGGSHTFNGAVGNCSGGNRSGNHAYEPGSGSTIQAYAGICGSDNLQTNSDAIFHSESHAQMISHVTNGTGANCFVPTVLSNSVPVAEAGPNFTIPKQTPFKLTGEATDADAADQLTYLWEQRDLGPQATLTASDDGQIPLFRVFTPDLSPMRYLPRLASLSTNTTNDSEKLPDQFRTMSWRVSVRDNNGGVDSDDMQVSVDDGSGPFLVSSPNGGETVGGNYEVTWDVAGTDGSAVNASTVDIFLSQDSGLTFDFANPLATAAANDGNQIIVMPNVETALARIMVVGGNNIFFDISDEDFRIVPVGTEFELAANLWQQISLPAIPPAAANTVADIFADDILGAYGLDWQLFGYNAQIGQYFDVGLTGTLEPGAGYWIIQTSTAPNATIDLPPGSTPTPTTNDEACTSIGGCFSLGLSAGAAGLHMIGNPFYSTPNTDDFRVTSDVAPCNANVGCTLTEASEAPEGANIIADQFLWWNGGPSYASVGQGDVFDDWRGYWVAVYADAASGNAVLLIPRDNIPAAPGS